MIVSPCDSSWWAKREMEGTSLSGFQFKTAIGEFVIEGRASKEMSRKNGPRGSIKATTISKRSTGEMMAQFKDRSSIVFLDGVSFTATHRNRFPLFLQSRYEFFDKGGRLQFSNDRKNKIWLTSYTDRNHVLFLIAADRFLREVDMAEAPG